MTQITSPNGTVTYTYDNGDRLTDVWHKKNDNTVLEHFTYAYNNANHITRRTDTNGDVTSFGYDNADQLTSESRTGANSYSITYTYDGNGNRLTKVQGGVTTNYTYQTNSDRLATAGTKSYVYDNNGNCTEVKVSGVTTVTLTYDYENRVTGISYTGGGSNSFQYNGLNLRTKKVDSAGTFHYVTDGVTPGSDVLKDGAAVYTPGVSERRGTTSKYFQGDHLGSTRAITNSSQTQTDTWIYDAFGRVMNRTGTSVAPFQFAGGWQYQSDADSGLMLLGHRYYDSETGRFISPDPIGDGDNWYTYCENNPLGAIDPSGLSTVPLSEDALNALYDFIGKPRPKPKPKDPSPGTGTSTGGTPLPPPPSPIPDGYQAVYVNGQWILVPTGSAIIILPPGKVPVPITPTPSPTNPGTPGGTPTNPGTPGTKPPNPTPSNPKPPNNPSGTLGGLKGLVDAFFRWAIRQMFGGKL